MKRIAFVFLSVFFMMQPLQAYFTTLDTGEVVQVNKYKATLAPQFVLSDFEGVNFVGNFDTGLSESTSVRAMLGFGTVDFHAGAFFKYVPFPDVEGQPAIGLSSGVVYGHVEDENQLSLRFHPLVSKKFDTDIGDMTPYGSIPFGLTSGEDDNLFPIQLVGGVEWRPVDFEYIRILAEVGFDINEAFSYITFGAALHFDDEQGIRFE